MHRMVQFLRGEPVGLDGLDSFFSDIDRLNRAFFDRLNRAVQRDAGINALVSLQSHSMLASMSIKPEMENIRTWFQQTLSGDTGEIVPGHSNGA